MNELGWIAQFSQMTASAALTAVLGWLLYQMPRYFDSERKSREGVAKNYGKAIEDVLTSHRQQMQYEREMCERHHREALESQDRHYREAQESQERRHAAMQEALDRRHSEAITHSGQQYRELIARVEASHLLLRETNHTLNNSVNAEAMRRAAEEMRRRGGKAPPPEPDPVRATKPDTNPSSRGPASRP